jgi:hypothetical protein
MSSFRGFSLIRLNKAVDASQHEAYNYDVTIVDILGRITQSFLSVSDVDRNWCGLRMNGDRFAKLQSGECKPITEEEFNSLYHV